MRLLFTCFCCLFFGFTLDLAAFSWEVRGRVVDKHSGSPLPYVTLSVGSGAYTLADEEGRFRIRLQQRPAELRLVARLVGKKPVEERYVLQADQEVLEVLIRMEDNDLFMQEVVVAAERDDENVSVSAFKIDRSTIEQSQANSLNELLQLIPGQEIRNPQLQGAQAINFRSALAGQQSLNNAFGIGIFINDNQLDNNSNMQGLNPRTAGTFRSMGATNFGGRSFASGDAPAGGFDLRQIPVGNIEKVEIIQGVASAEYGDIGAGAIIIETSAGQSPLRFTYRQAGGDRNFQLDKGFQLQERHALHVSFDYLNSNPDLRDNVKSFNRLTGNAILTSFFGASKSIKNNLSLSMHTNLDDFRIDPDFGTERIVFYQNQGLSLSNRLQVNKATAVFDSFKFVVSYNRSRSLSVLDQFVNPGVLPVTVAMEPGIHVGTFHPSSYRARREIHGLPVSSGMQANFYKNFSTGKISHELAYGASYRFNGNFGEGRQFDPLRPIRFAGAATNERPLSFREINPVVHQWGAYVENRMRGTLFGKAANLSTGLRADRQFGLTSFSPRINASYALSDKVRVTGAFGEAVKAPGLIHLFPGPQFEDFTLLNFFTGRETESLFLAFTHVIPNDPSGLRSMRTSTRELGLHIKGDWVTVGLTGFYNSTRNGFSINSDPVRLDLPRFEVIARPEGQQPIFRQTGETMPVVVTERSILNTSSNTNTGLEATLSTKRIPAINTSFSLNLSYYRSSFLDTRERVQQVRNFQPAQEIWYGIYGSQASEAGRSLALLTASHHVPRLGLVLTLRHQLFITNYTRSFDRSNRPIGFLDNNLERFSLTEEEFLNDPRFRILDQTAVEGNFVRRPDFVYMNFHLNLSKNLGKHVRFSFFANNFLNIRPEDVNPQGDVVGVLNEEPYFGLELNFKY
ncbi:MAG: TonB-dependent receptor [Nitritalea sp.]